MFYFEKDSRKRFVKSLRTSPLVLLPSCEPRLAQHHRLLLSNPSVFFSVPLLSLLSFSDTAGRTLRFFFIHIHLDLKQTFFFFLFRFFFLGGGSRETHPFTTTRRRWRQGANTATPILTPTVSTTVSTVFSMSACACAEEDSPPPV